MSETWNQNGFPTSDESQYPQDPVPYFASPAPYFNPQPYDYYGSSYDTVGSAMPFRQVRESNFHSGGVDNFSQVGHLTGQSVVDPGFGYSQNPLDSPGTTSYGLTRPSEAEYYEFVNATTDSSFHNPQPDSNIPVPQPFALTACSGEPSHAPQFRNPAGPSHIPAATGWTSFNSGCRYDATCPLPTTNDSRAADNVPDPNGQPRVIKKVVATGGVVDASKRRRHPIRPGRLYRCTGFPPCQATFTSSHNLKCNLFKYMYQEAR
uniref:Uncharacterized protein n=1 Tax=Moniliophthora roreri TaxID=221103 RepID=A0A0W0GE58_MONRR